MILEASEFVNRWRFSRAVRGILSTPPITGRGDRGVTLLSMVQHCDVLPYLLALKSLCRYVSPARVVLVADPTLDESDRLTLRHHVPQIIIREASDFQRDGVPRGGCWERLCAIAEYAAASYVIQLDADTVTMREPTAVSKAIQDAVSFTLGTEDLQRIQSTAEAAAWSRAHQEEEDHIQKRTEAVLDRFDPEGKFRYVRGCAGFAGFAPGSISPALVTEISSRMSAILGADWYEWGTEQLTSNIIVASSAGGSVLPHPQYCNPLRMRDDTVFLHFIGYTRYRSRLYERVAREVINDLRSH